jgi:hypothetical protein
MFLSQAKTKTAKLVALLLLWLMLPSASSAFDFGLDIHQRTDQEVVDIMKSRNLKTARMDLTVDSDTAAFRSLADRIRVNGGRIEVSLQISYQWDNTCDQDLSRVEQNSYDETVAIVDLYKDVIYDYELLNEVTLRSETVAEVPFNSAGTSTLPYENKPCYSTMTAVLRGMSRAIHDIRTNSGYPLRVILGVVGRDFGFLTFMVQQGVVVDVVGFHIYPHSGDASLLSDPWYGDGGPFAQLAVFNLPVHVNEFNCGEIYDDGYDNQPGSAETVLCFQSYKKHIPSFFQQSLMGLEAVHVYELLDEPGKTGAESRFGLLYDYANPKVHLYIIAAFAGGTLADAERDAIINLGILTAEEIAAYWELAHPADSLPMAPANLKVVP